MEITLWIIDHEQQVNHLLLVAYFLREQSLKSTLHYSQIENDITPDQREKITDKMILIADKIAALDTENREFIKDIIKYGTTMIGGAIVLGAVILGVNIKGGNIPTINDNN